MYIQYQSKNMHRNYNTQPLHYSTVSRNGLHLIYTSTACSNSVVTQCNTLIYTVVCLNPEMHRVLNYPRTGISLQEISRDAQSSKPPHIGQTLVYRKYPEMHRVLNHPI